MKTALVTWYFMVLSGTACPGTVVGPFPTQEICDKYRTMTIRTNLDNIPRIVVVASDCWAGSLP